MTTFGDRVFQSGGIPVGDGYLGRLGDGQVFFVDPGNGDDANPGTTPTSAYATMSTAVGACTTERGDIIVRLPGTETVTAELEITTEGILIVASTSAYSHGAGRGAGAEYYLMWGGALTSAPVLTIREGVSIDNLSFANAYSASAAGFDSTGCAIAIRNEVSGDQGGFTFIRNCEFPSWGSNDAGVQLAGAAHVHIHRCSFGGASGTLPYGVRLHGTSTNNCINNIIEDNTFVNVTTGINFASATPQDTMILANYFCPTYTDAISWAGVTGGASLTGLVANNRFGSAVDGGSFSGFSGGSGDQAGQIESDSSNSTVFVGNVYSGTE